MAGFYLAIPVAFGIFSWASFGPERGTECFAVSLVEKSLSVGQPVRHSRRARSAALESLSITSLLFGLILLATSVKTFRDAPRGHEKELDSEDVPSAPFIGRIFPVTSAYEGTRMTVLDGGKRALTPVAVMTIAAPLTDAVFALDSVPAVRHHW